jgi:hypothetical protein
LANDLLLKKLLRRLYMTYYPGFWFDLLLKVTEVKVQNVTISWHLSLLFDLEYSNIVLIGLHFLPNFGRIGHQILPDGPLRNILLHLGYVVVGYTSERHGCTLPELITFSLSIITFSLSRTRVEVSNVAACEHMVPGPFHLSSFYVQHVLKTFMLTFCLG